VIAGRGSDDPATALFRGKLQQGIARARSLKLPVALQIFQLAKNLHPVASDSGMDGGQGDWITEPAIRLPLLRCHGIAPAFRGK